MKKEYHDRLIVISSLIEQKKYTLNIGSKDMKLGDINADIDPSCQPDVTCDVRKMPFESGKFEQVIFTDVIEHLPKGSEMKALNEINRVLKYKGTLILSTPNNRFLFNITDPVFYMGHRHYKKEVIEKLLKDTGFEIEKIFTVGNFWSAIGSLWYCFITYPLKKVFNLPFRYSPNFLQSLIDKGYKIHSDKGYTIFVKALKSKRIGNL